MPRRGEPKNILFGVLGDRDSSSLLAPSGRLGVGCIHIGFLIFLSERCCKHKSGKRTLLDSQSGISASALCLYNSEITTFKQLVNDFLTESLKYEPYNISLKCVLFL